VEAIDDCDEKSARPALGNVLSLQNENENGRRPSSCFRVVVDHRLSHRLPFVSLQLPLLSINSSKFLDPFSLVVDQEVIWLRSCAHSSCQAHSWRCTLSARVMTTRTLALHFSSADLSFYKPSLYSTLWLLVGEESSCHGSRCVRPFASSVATLSSNGMIVR
jgi:hypothetical protein